MSPSDYGRQPQRESACGACREVAEAVDERWPEAVRGVESVEYRVLVPVGEVAIVGLSQSEVMRQVAPGNSGPVDVEDRVHDPARIVLGRPADVRTVPPFTAA